MSDSKNRDYSSAILIMFTVAILSLVIAIYKDSLFAAFISGFFFSCILELVLVLDRKAKENSK